MGRESSEMALLSEASIPSDTLGVGVGRGLECCANVTCAVRTKPIKSKPNGSDKYFPLSISLIPKMDATPKVVPHLLDEVLQVRHLSKN